MLITEETQRRIDNMPLPFRIVCNALLDCLENVLGYKYKCNTEELVKIVSDLEQNAKGKYCNQDLVNYDQACDMLGYTRTNRVALKRELDRNGIQQVTINGHRVGFPKKDVERLASKRRK